jgi:hypothetical protein
MAPLVNPYLMTTRANQGFWLLADRLTLSATSPPTLSPIPSSIYVALADPKWHHAMEEEFVALITNNTWDLVLCPVGSNVITGKWIFKRKFNSDGSLDRYKARWVFSWLHPAT